MFYLLENQTLVSSILNLSHRLGLRNKNFLKILNRQYIILLYNTNKRSPLNFESFVNVMELLALADTYTR